MDQYLLIPFLVGWTSIYQLFWCSPGVQGFDTLPCELPVPSLAIWNPLINGHWDNHRWRIVQPWKWGNTPTDDVFERYWVSGLFILIHTSVGQSNECYKYSYAISISHKTKPISLLITRVCEVCTEPRIYQKKEVETVSLQTSQIGKECSILQPLQLRRSLALSHETIVTCSPTVWERDSKFKDNDYPSFSHMIHNS